MEKQNIPEGFSDVDQTGEAGHFIYYLDAISALEVIQAYKRLTFSLLNVQAGHHILDIGCGTGNDVRTLASTVGMSGRVVGVDTSEAMITEAWKRSEGSNLPVEYRLGDAHQLDFADNTFDGCRADRTFQHLETPHKALAEMLRVARPEARIVIAEPDWETLVVDASNRALTRSILNFSCDSIHNGWLGRQLPVLFKASGLKNIAVVPQTVIFTDYALANQIFQLQGAVQRAQETGVVSAAEGAHWLNDLNERSQTGRFFSAITGFIVCGRKP